MNKQKRNYIISSPDATGYLSYIEGHIKDAIRKKGGKCDKIYIEYTSKHPELPERYCTSEQIEVIDGYTEVYDVLMEIDVIVKQLLADTMTISFSKEKKSADNLEFSFEHKYDTQNILKKTAEEMQSAL